MKKIFIPFENIRDEFAFISGDDYHHLKNVLRKEIGDIINLSDGKFAYKAEIVEFNSDNMKLKVLEKNKIEPPLLKLRIFQSIPKGKIEDIISKATEFGVFEFYPTISSRTIVKIEENAKPKKLAKWEKIILETAKKVGISPPMRLGKIINLSEIEKFISKEEPKIVFWESEEEKSLKNILKSINIKKPINVLIGPEGGFSLKEIEILRNAGWITVSLGKRIYTVETATIVGIANILYQLENNI
ncbi:MAG: 16S rRNA (uracil(1498)-N(3))-methyltransferase [Brevinematales bacterium]|nr:16S rRNA (uracil(1498)-N(3))-methyltransferase [Brevinematales bacterium]